MSPSAESTPRPLRADAERNRRRILDAAGELFAAKGLSVGLDEIARHAGVGVATAYRRFPDKERLIEALFEDRVAGLVALAERGLADDDPWSGLAGFIESGVELQSADRGLKELVFGSEHGESFVARARARLAPLVEELLRRAQAGGAVRGDLEATDMPLMQIMLGAISDVSGPSAPELWRRYLAIVLDGLRATSTGDLPVPALTPDEFARVVRLAPPRPAT